MRPAGAPKPHKRDGVWYLIRRVPKEFELLDRRGLVRISTQIAVADDPRGKRAGEVVGRLQTELEAYWRGLRDGQSAEARLRFEAAQRRARTLGLTYQTSQELAAGAATDDILQRIQLLLDNNAVEDEAEVAAVLGGEARPALLLSGLMDEYEELIGTSLIAMSPNQRKKWGNPKRRAIGNFIEVVGDKKLTELTRDDALKFRGWWQKRVIAEKLDIGTANKDIGHVSKMLTVVDDAHRLALDPVFAKLRLEGEMAGQRAAFDARFVQEKILKFGALDGLNEEARDVVYLIADTGLRLSEAVNLLPEHIRVDAKVPYVEVLAVGRKLKTDHSAREIPLVGAALDAMRRHPQGFPRYRDKAASLSAIVNKVMKGRKLLPSGNHTLYSLRHTFEDRLTAVDAPDKIIATLMGHKFDRPKYGAGPTLDLKRKWLLRIAFTPPAHPDDLLL